MPKTITPVLCTLTQASLILTVLAFGGLPAPAQTRTIPAGERVTHLVDLLRTSQLASAVELTDDFQNQAATIRAEKPRVLWDEMISDLRAAHLDAIRSRGERASPLALLRSLVVGADDITLLEERAHGSESVVFIRLRWDEPSHAPFQRNRLLKETIGRIRLDQKGNLDYVELVDEATEYWSNPPLRITMVEYRGEGIGGFRVSVGWIGSGDRTDFTLSLGNLERAHSSNVAGEKLRFDTVISERRAIPEEAFPLTSQLRVTDSSGASDEVQFTIPRFHTGLISPDVWVRDPWFSLGDWDAAGNSSSQGDYMQFEEFEPRDESAESSDTDGQRQSAASTAQEVAKERPRFLIMKKTTAVAKFNRPVDPQIIFKEAKNAVIDAKYVVTKVDESQHRVEGFSDRQATSFSWSMEVRSTPSGEISLWIERGSSGRRVPNDIPALIKYIAQKSGVTRLRSIALSYGGEEKPLTNW